MMTQESREQLLVAIREDDVKAFASFADPEVFSLTFGRFPLLSLLYLFEAKSIVKTYLPDLVKERPREKEPSFYEADKLFLQKGGKALRYFSQREVSPLEMLAVLGERTQLRKLYAIYPRAERYLPSIKRIYYTRLGKEIAVSEKGELMLPKEPLSFLLRKRLLLFIALFLSLFLVFGGVTIFTFAYWGIGTQASYSKVRSEQLLVSSAQSGKYLSLKKDIAFSQTLEDFATVLDGEDHIVRLHAPFAETLTGELRNVIFVLEEDFVGEAVISENQGIIKNVRLVAEGYALHMQEEKEFVGLLTSCNKGNIEDCNAVISVEISSETGKDCSFAPFAGSNEGRVQNCRTDGSIKGDVVDVAGVVGFNDQSGVVTDCVVIADFYSGASIEGWSPNVAGVALQSDGTIYGCTVTGKIASEQSGSDPEGEKDFGSAYAAGIACKNGGTVKNCVNESSVTATASSGACYASGIVALNGYKEYELIQEPNESGEIEEVVKEKKFMIGTTELCVCKGPVSALSQNDEAYAAGITYKNGGSVKSCANESTVTATASNGACFAAGIAALNGYKVYEIEQRQNASGEIVENRRVKEIVLGTTEDCACKGDVQAESESYNTYAGGIVSINETGSVVTLSFASGKVDSKAEGNIYDVAGGIIADNRGIVTDSFFTGSLEVFDEDSLNGAICGISVHPMFVSYLSYVQNNGYEKGDCHAFGALSYGDSIVNIAAYMRATDAYLFDYGATIYETAEEAEAAFAEIKAEIKKEGTAQ